MKNIAEDYFLHRIKPSFQKEANLLLATTGTLKSVLNTYTLVITNCSIKPKFSSSMNYQHYEYQASIVNQHGGLVKVLNCEGSPNQCFEHLAFQFEKVLIPLCDTTYLEEHNELFSEELPEIENNDPTYRLTPLQQEVDQWINTLGVRYFSELTNLSNLIEEVGEVARLIGREYGEQSFKQGERPACIKSAIADELSDVLFIIVCLANQIGINLDDAFIHNMAKKTKRDIARHANNKKLKSQEKL